MIRECPKGMKDAKKHEAKKKYDLGFLRAPSRASRMKIEF
jgi:hypothetical protein